MKLTNNPVLRYRIILAINAALLIPIDYLMRFSPVLPEWFRNLSGNIAYEMLLVMLVLLVAPRVLPRGAAIGVCLTSFVLRIFTTIPNAAPCGSTGEPFGTIDSGEWVYVG